MTFPVPQATAITDGYDAPRPQPSWPEAKHWALDIAAPDGSWIVAPESGALIYHYLVPIEPDGRPDLQHDGATWPFSRWYTADRYGATVALVNRQRWWLFTHIWPTEMFRQCHVRGLNVQPIAAPGFHAWEAYTTLYDEPWPYVPEGTIIAAVGSAGRSSGPHTHMELHPPRGAGRPDFRLDPGRFWPETVERLKG